MARSGRFGAVVAGVALISTLLASCGGSSGGGGGSTNGTEGGSGGDSGSGTTVMRFGVPGKFHSLDPRQAGSFDTIYVELLYDRLITTTENGEYAPGLATSWKLTADSFDMTLKSGVTFQDGAPFNAAAVKANIEAAKKPTSNLRDQLAVISSVEVVDPTHVSLKLSGPGGHLVGVFASYAGMMISPKAVNNPDLKSHPVGAGPFKLESVGQNKVVFTKWSGYPEANSIELDEVDLMTYLDTTAMLRAIKSGQLDGGSLGVSQVEEARDAGLTVKVKPVTVLYGILLNTGKSEFGNPLVRKALMHAIDRDAIAKGLYAGQATPTCQPYPEGYWAYAPELKNCAAATYDLDKAKQLLAQAGLSDGFSFVLSTITVPAYQKLAQTLQAELKKIGVNATIKSATTLVEQRRSGDFDAIVGAFQAGVPDPTVFVTDYYTPDGLYNPGGFSIPGGKALLKQARQSADLDTRAVPIRELLKKAVDAGPPLTPIAMRSRVIVVKKGITDLGLTMLSDFDFATVKMPK